MSTAQFYDQLAGTYHWLYRDWPAEVASQAAALDQLLSGWHSGALDIVDTACGIGTQLTGLARLGHRLTGTDISRAAIARAREECASAGVQAALVTADMRALPLASGTADAVVCADNALPHLLADDEVLEALQEARRVLRPEGTGIFTTRDYDAALRDRPPGTLPQVHADKDGPRRITFQLWHWREGSAIYDVEHFQLEQAAEQGWATVCRTVTYRAFPRAQLTSLARAAGFSCVAWRMPSETGFFQPIMITRH